MNPYEDEAFALMMAKQILADSPKKQDPLDQAIAAVDKLAASLQKEIQWAKDFKYKKGLK